MSRPRLVLEICGAKQPTNQPAPTLSRRHRSHTEADGRFSAKASTRTWRPSRRPHHRFPIHAARRRPPARLAAFFDGREDRAFDRPHRCWEILSWPSAGLDRARLSMKVQVVRIILMIASKTLFNGSLDRRDSPLEGTGFELLVRGRGEAGFVEPFDAPVCLGRVGSRWSVGHLLQRIWPSCTGRGRAKWSSAVGC
jgi:hypothetical protein